MGLLSRLQEIHESLTYAWDLKERNYSTDLGPNYQYHVLDSDGTVVFFGVDTNRFGRDERNTAAQTVALRNALPGLVATLKHLKTFVTWAKCAHRNGRDCLQRYRAASDRVKPSMKFCQRCTALMYIDGLQDRETT